MSTAVATARRPRRRATAGVLFLSLIAATAVYISARANPASAAGCKIYVAAGDNVTNGDAMNDNSSRYPEKLVADHIKSPGWCLYNQGKNGQTSSSFVTGGGLSNAYNMRPDLLTLQLGEQNSTIVNLVTTCFDQVKNHDFAAAMACASVILGNSSLWTDLTNNYTTILQQTRVMQSQRPLLVVAVVNYPNPYPQSADVLSDIGSLCTGVIDNIAPCIGRWTQLPPALDLLDQVFQKMNTTLKNALAPFQAGPSGNRWVYVDDYPKFKGHCMTMKVTLYTTVEHPELEGTVHEHDSQEVNFGCSKNWFVEGSDGNYPPIYLIPSAPGVLINFRQTTKGMGVYPNSDGHKCISDSIWEADTIDPGTTPLKWKLGYGEAANSNICQ